MISPWHLWCIRNGVECVCVGESEKRINYNTNANIVRCYQWCAANHSTRWRCDSRQFELGHCASVYTVHTLCTKAWTRVFHCSLGASNFCLPIDTINHLNHTVATKTTKWAHIHVFIVLYASSSLFLSSYAYLFHFVHCSMRFNICWIFWSGFYRGKRLVYPLHCSCCAFFSCSFLSL